VHACPVAHSQNALLEHVVHRLWGGGAGTQLLTPFRTVHLHTHIREHTACPVYVLILCVHGNSQYALLEHVVHSSGVVVQAHNC